jgi:tetratricopeptide (TPR) repeat protein
MLYEAYIALGKKYDSLGLYFDAIKNYQQAEIIAFEDLENLMKLFQVQVYLGSTYGQVKDFEGAISYYEYALNVIQLKDRISDSSILNDRLNEVNELVEGQNFTDAFPVYQSIFEDIEFVYSNSEEEMREGTCLALFASSHQSTVNAIFNANTLPERMIYSFKQELTVPSISN